MKTSAITKMTTWEIDPVHTTIQFSVRHMVIANLIGYFRKFEGKVVKEGDDFEKANIAIKIDPKSIDTNHEQRDSHLVSAEFIDTEKYPTITFKSTSIKKVDKENYLITGDLSLNGITKSIEMSAKYNGAVIDPYKNKRAGFEASTGINRKDFGVNWHAVLDSGGLVAGDNVMISTQVEIITKNEGDTQ